jgi:ribosomal protein L37AE/L43A
VSDLDKAMRDALRADQAKLEAMTGEQYPLDFEPDYDCPGCQGGEKWPVSESVWRCPVCDTEFYDTDATP